MPHEIRDGLKLFICRKCPRLGGKDAIIVARRTRCPLCEQLVKKYTTEEANGQVVSIKPKNGKINGVPIDVPRFPRLLASTPEQKKVVEVIEERTTAFDCPGRVTNVIEGPVVTEYEFTPDKYTRAKKLKTLDEDLALGLSVTNVTIRRMKGKSAMGIAIPNVNRKAITFDDCLKNVIDHRFDMELPLNFGITGNGLPYVEDMARFPHMLLSGTTGTGKSVLINQLLTNLIMVRSPKQLELVLIDPKTVELFPYKGLAHLRQEPVRDVYEALGALNTLDQEMRRRTQNLHVLHVNNIKELNDRIKNEAKIIEDQAKATSDLVARNNLIELAMKKRDEQWPYILVVIDEMADLVLQEKALFTERLASLAGQARAAGICILAATQRPSVDVLSGKIKCNFLARASLKMPAAQDSKTALGYKGAETLLGKGDMFLSSPDQSDLQRIHIPHCTREDRTKILQRSIELGYNNGVPADTFVAVATPEPTVAAAKPVLVTAKKKAVK